MIRAARVAARALAPVERYKAGVPATWAVASRSFTASPMTVSIALTHETSVVRQTS